MEIEAMDREGVVVLRWVGRRKGGGEGNCVVVGSFTCSRYTWYAWQGITWIRLGIDPRDALSLLGAVQAGWNAPGKGDHLACWTNEMGQHLCCLQRLPSPVGVGACRTPRSQRREAHARMCRARVNVIGNGPFLEVSHAQCGQDD